MEGAKTVAVKAQEALEEIRKVVRGERKVENRIEAIDDILFDYERFAAVTQKIVDR